MRWIKNGLFGAGALAILLAASCDKTRTMTMNAPETDDTAPPPEWAECWDQHNDQAMLQEMCITDIHFVPHSTRLSNAGELRLERYAQLLENDGGTIHYDSRITDHELLAGRLAMVREYMAHTGPGKNLIAIELGRDYGRGMTAEESIPGNKVAKQPEKRDDAYELNVAGPSTGGN